MGLLGFKAVELNGKASTAVVQQHYILFWLKVKVQILNAHKSVLIPRCAFGLIFVKL